MYSRSFNTLKTQIKNEAQNPAKIEIMLFFAGLDKPMQLQIREQFDISDTKHDLLLLARKLELNLDYDLKSSLPTRSRTPPLILIVLKKTKFLRLALSMEEAVGKIFCVFIVMNQNSKRRKVGKNPVTLSKAKKLDPMPPE